MSAVEVAPSIKSSAISFPVIGPQRMPQQLCPQDRKMLSWPGTGPIIGIASGGHGRMHACVLLGPCTPAVRAGAIAVSDLCAAATLLEFASILSAVPQSPA